MPAPFQFSFVVLYYLKIDILFEGAGALNDSLQRFWHTLPWNRPASQADDAPDLDHVVDPAGSEAGEDDAAFAPVLDASPEDERVLVQQAKEGHQEAFADLVAAHHANIYGLACRTVRDPDEAAEITQDVFLAAWRGLAGFRGESRFGTWLYRITYRRCLQSIEARQNRLEGLAQLTSLSMERLANEWGEMQANMAEQEWRQAIRDQIALLPEKYREVLLLRHWHDLTYEEIAQQLTMPISSVKTHLFRARALCASGWNRWRCPMSAARCASAWGH